MMSTNSIEDNKKSSKLSTVASFIQNLTKEDPQARENSIITLLTNLVKFQNEFQETLGTEEFEKNLGEVKEFEELGLILHSDVIYTLKRLITGLNSSRDDARQGFALTLTELIRIFNFIPFNPLFNGILKFSKISSSMKSEETRNNLFGRLFSLMSLNQSDYLKQSHITLQNWELVLSTLLDLTNQKIFMSDSVYSLFYKLVETLKDLSFGEDALFSLWKLNLETGLEYPDELGLALSIYNAIPSRIGAIKEDIPIIRLDQWPQLANVLAKQKPFQKSGLHHCWKIILDSFFTETPLSKYFKSQFSQFWNVVVDEYLFVSSLNERRFIGFQALNYIITKLSKDQLNIVFTDNTLKKVIHHLNRSDDDLHKMASITAEKIAQAVQEDQSSSISLLVRLHSLGGVKSASGPKEKISQSAISKITDPLMSNLNEEGVLNYINYLNSIFIGKETVPGRDTSSGRDWSVNQLFLIQKWAKLLHSEQIYDQILEFFLIHTFFAIKKESSKSNLIPLKSIPTPEPSESVRKLCKDKLLATLKDSIKLAPLTTDKSSTSSKRKGTRVDGKLWVQHAVELLDKLKKDKNIELVEEIDQEVEEIIKSTLTKVKDIEKKKNKLKDSNHKDYHPLQAFLTLFLHQIILLHIQPEESLNSIKDIEICYTKLIAPVKITRSKAKKLKEAEEETEEEELEPIDVLVDLLISFLSQPSTLLRELATVTFTELTDLITKSSLELLLEVLEIGGKSEGLNEDDEELEAFPELDENDDAMSVDEDDDDEEGEDDDEDDDDDDDEDDSDIEEIDGSGGIQIDLAKLKELQAAYEESDEERDYNDEEMMAFDEKLSAIFVEKKKALREKKEVKESVSILKMKVLDLFSIYISRQPNNPNLVHLILPLLSFIKRFQGAEGHANATDKAARIVSKELTKLELKDVDLEVIENILTEIDQLARKAPGAQQKLYLPIALFSVRHLESQAFDKVLEVYKNTLKWTLTNKKSTIKPQWFTELFQQSLPLGWALGESLVSYLDPNTALNPFRLTKTLEILNSLINTSIKRKYTAEGGKAFINSIFIAIEDMIKFSINNTDSKIIKVDQIKEGLRLSMKLKQYIKAVELDSDYQPWMSEEFKQNLIKFCGLFDSSSSSLVSLYKQLTGNKLDIVKSTNTTGNKRSLKENGAKKSKKQKTNKKN